MKLIIDESDKKATNVRPSRLYIGELGNAWAFIIHR